MNNASSLPLYLSPLALVYRIESKSLFLYQMLSLGFVVLLNSAKWHSTPLFQNNRSEIVMINTRKHDNLYIFAWTMKYLYLGLNLELELELGLDLDLYLNLDLDAAESLCIWELGV